MPKSTLETTFEKYRYDSNIATKSKTWFQQQALLLQKGNTRITSNKLFREGVQTTRLTPGKLYMFYYDPKFKDTLPYYDTFPLVFPYSKVKGGFMGLNMHYLPHYYRVQLMTRLMQFANNKNFDETTKIKYSWSLIGGASKFRFAEPCIKHYLNDHVKSTFLEIPGNDWHTAMMLPVEHFVGANKTKVWGDSVKV
jgi:hypothetical protein